MNDAVITDLKQLITVTISQQITELSNKVDQLGENLTQKVEALDSRMNDLQNFLFETHDINNERIDAALTNHEARITGLESKFV